MRRMFTTSEARAGGSTDAQLRWGAKTGRWVRAGRGVWAEGPESPTRLERALAATVAARGVASGRLAGVLLGLDGVALTGPDFTVRPGASNRRPGARRRALPPERVIQVGDVPCTDGVQTLVDLGAELSDDRWEQALEAALRQGLVSLDELRAALDAARRSRLPGGPRMRRVLSRRPQGAPPTESLLETLMVQLARRVEGLGDPVRQYVVVDAHGLFVARCDLVWPRRGLFIELDGQHHEGQPLYDANRQTAVAAATGWLCGRFTWHEVVHTPAATARRLAALADRGGERRASLE